MIVGRGCPCCTAGKQMEMDANNYQTIDFRCLKHLVLRSSLDVTFLIDQPLELYTKRAAEQMIYIRVRIITEA